MPRVCRTLVVQVREGAIPSRSMGRCGELEMGNEPSELEGGSHWDDIQCSELWCANWLEVTEGMEKEMTILQKPALCKTLGAGKGSSGDKINAIAEVESVEVFVEAATGRLLARTMCNPLRVGIGWVERALEEEGSLLLGVAAGRGRIMWWT